MAKEKDKNALPTLNINKQYINNSKLMRVLGTKDIDIDNDENTFNLVVQNDIISFVDVWTDPNITLTQQVTRFDMAVMDAAYTIMNSGLTMVTAEWIARVMSGNKDQKLTDNKLKNIRASIDKLRSVHIRIDCTEEISARKGKKGKDKSFVYESYLLPLDKIEARYEANGKEVIAYPVLTKPALYRYAEEINQIIEIPTRYLETQEYFSDTDEAILIKRYVIKRVAQITSNNKLTNDKLSLLWYEKTGEARGLIPELGYKPDGTAVWRRKKLKIMEIVKGTLQTLVDSGAIDSFEEYKGNGTNGTNLAIMGYEIKYHKIENMVEKKKKPVGIMTY